MVNEKKHYNPCSSYPECSHCPARGKDDCPALYRYTEHCPHYSKVVQMIKERQKKASMKSTIRIYCAGCGVFLRETEFSKNDIEFKEYCFECHSENEEEEDLWENNEFCPLCNNPVDPEIISCETGYSYCSKQCAKKHVNQVYQEEDED